MYPALGAIVSYIRFDKDGKIERGHGVMRGYGLDHGNRPVAIIGMDDAKQISVYSQCVDPDDDFCAKFSETFERVEQIAATAKDAQQKIVSDANSAIDREWDAILGAAIVVPTIPAGGAA